MLTFNQSHTDTCSSNSVFLSRALRTENKKRKIISSHLASSHLISMWSLSSQQYNLDQSLKITHLLINSKRSSFPPTEIYQVIQTDFLCGE